MIQEHTNADSIGPVAALRYVGVDIRPRSFGFVVIENMAVLDSGARACDLSQFHDCLGQRFLRILQMSGPSAVIMRAPSGRGRRDKKRTIADAIKKQAKQYGAELICISPAAVRRHFRQYNASAKHEIAQEVARILPDLAWKLPRRRKPWETENHRMSLFDAAAAVITHVMQ